jgi:hypothetical protein
MDDHRPPLAGLPIQRLFQATNAPNGVLKDTLQAPSSTA